MVVPFGGGEAEPERAALGALELVPEDEVIVADNSGGRAGGLSDLARVIPATRERSSYHARNVGARAARNDWLLFIDADCVPPPRLLDDYLGKVPGSAVGILAGEVRGLAEQSGRLTRWARSRRGLLASHHQDSGPYPAGITGNLLVRRAALEAVGGFDEEVREAADLDFCWRVQQAGWELVYTPGAVVGHRDPERLGQVLRQAFRYGIGLRSLRRRYGPTARAPGTGRAFLRGLAGAVIWPLAARPERGLFKLIDAVVAIATGLGYGFGDLGVPAGKSRSEH